MLPPKQAEQLPVLLLHLVGQQLCLQQRNYLAQLPCCWCWKPSAYQLQHRLSHLALHLRLQVAPLQLLALNCQWIQHLLLLWRQALLVVLRCRLWLTQAASCSHPWTAPAR